MPPTSGPAQPPDEPGPTPLYPGLAEETGLPDAYPGRWLRTVELPGTPFLVSQRVPFGLWLHNAPAGSYKSAFASQIEHHIAYGQPLPGLTWKFSVTGAHCLVIVPDESIYEVQDRSLRILPGGHLATDGWDHADTDIPQPDIHHRHAPQGGTVEQRLAWLISEVNRLEQATHIPVAWIRWDTVGSLLGERDSTDAYTHSMPLQKMNLWCAHNQKVMFLPNHVGKNGRLIGTTGLVGSSNLSTFTEMTRASNTGVITCDFKDGKIRGAAPWELAIKAKNGLLEFDDLSPQQARHGLGTLPRRVTDYLAQHGPQPIAGLRTGTAIEDGILWAVVQRLKKGAEIEPVYMEQGTHWALTDKGTGSPDPIMIPNPRGPQPLPQAPAPSEPAAAVALPQAPAAALTSTVPAPAVSDRGERPEAASTAEAEAWPIMDTGNHAITRMLEMVSGSRLYPLRRLPPEIKAQLRYEAVCLGGTPNRWQYMVDEKPEGTALVLDRRASYFQSCKTWLVPNALRRMGDLDYGMIARKSLGGMFQIIAPKWDVQSGRAYPLGRRVTPGTEVLVPRPTLDRLVQVSREGLCEEPAILWGLIGKGTESLLTSWGRWCIDERRGLRGEALDSTKSMQSQAISCLRIVDKDKHVGPIDRPDWQYAIHGHHYAMINRYACAIQNEGRQLLATGNTDEIVVLIPPNQNPESWVPTCMMPHIHANRLSVKARRDAAEWFADPLNRKNQETEMAHG